MVNEAVPAISLNSNTYKQHRDSWRRSFAAIEGEPVVKSKDYRELFIPREEGHVKGDGAEGRYTAYVDEAHWLGAPEKMARALQALTVGEEGADVHAIVGEVLGEDYVRDVSAGTSWCSLKQLVEKEVAEKWSTTGRCALVNTRIGDQVMTEVVYGHQIVNESWDKGGETPALTMVVIEDEIETEGDSPFEIDRWIRRRGWYIDSSGEVVRETWVAEFNKNENARKWELLESSVLLNAKGRPVRRIPVKIHGDSDVDEGPLRAVVEASASLFRTEARIANVERWMANPFVYGTNFVQSEQSRLLREASQADVDERGPESLISTEDGNYYRGVNEQKSYEFKFGSRDIPLFGKEVEFKKISISDEDVGLLLRQKDEKRKDLSLVGGKMFDRDKRVAEAGTAEQTRRREDSSIINSDANSLAWTITHSLQMVAELKGAEFPADRDETLVTLRPIPLVLMTADDAMKLSELVVRGHLPLNVVWERMRDGGIIPTGVRDEQLEADTIDARTTYLQGPRSRPQAPPVEEPGAELDTVAGRGSQGRGR